MSFQIIAITNRTLCAEPLPQRVSALCEAGIDRVIVREKDLSTHEYEALLQAIFEAIEPDQRDLITINTFVEAARLTGVASVQLSLIDLQEHPDFAREFASVGVSVHGKAEALLAQKLGADYLIAGHIFATDCKPGLAPRGLDFLREVCDAVAIPVYAIGGIDEHTIDAVKEAGAQGACLMSDLMTCSDMAEELQCLRKAVISV